MTEKGVWRTVRGRRVFIKEGQSLRDAMIDSGKFGNLESQIKKEIADLEKEQEKYAQKMNEYSRYAVMGYGDPKYSEEKRKIYRDNQIRFSNTRKKINELYTQYDKIQAKKTKQNIPESKPMRNITSETYKRQQRRQAKEIMKFIGG